MACPFFDPQRRLAPGSWAHKPRMPLGDAYSGLCRAREPFSPGFAPEEEHQREFCNRGYARDSCEHFPASSAADAVRFSVAGEAGGRLRLIYVFEKDHAPTNHGELELSDVPVATPDDDLLNRQAQAFVHSYFKSVEESKVPAR